MSRADVIRGLRKSADHAFDHTDQHVKAISTGSLAVDSITGIGGFPRGRISEVFGWEYSGKTTLCVQACAGAQAAGLYPVYIDAEQALDRTLAERIGFDWADDKKALYVMPRTFEEAMLITEEMVTKGEADLIIVDSIPAMTPEDTLKGKITDFGALGQLARLLSMTCGKLVKIIKDNNAALVFINQFRETVDTRPGAQYRPKEKTAGGSALRYYSSLRIVMSVVTVGSQKRKIVDAVGKEREIAIQSIHRAKTIKNKVGMPYREIDFHIRYDEALGVFGIDNTQTLIEMAIAADLIDAKGGGMFTYKGAKFNFNTRGADAVYDYLCKHPEVVAEITLALPTPPGASSPS